MRVFLLILLVFVGATATVSGLMLMIRPDGALMQMPTAILLTSPFRNFFIPGIVLFALVGLVNGMAACLLIRRHPAQYDWAMVGGVMIGGWIVVQIILIQSLSWLQFIYLGAGLLMVLAARQLKGKWLV